MGAALNVRHPLDLMAGIQCEVNARYPAIWDIRGYGLSQVWVKRSSTVKNGEQEMNLERCNLCMVRDTLNKARVQVVI